MPVCLTEQRVRSVLGVRHAAQRRAGVVTAWSISLRCHSRGGHSSHSPTPYRYIYPGRINVPAPARPARILAQPLAVSGGRVDAAVLFTVILFPFSFYFLFRPSPRVLLYMGFIHTYMHTLMLFLPLLSFFSYSTSTLFSLCLCLLPYSHSRPQHGRSAGGGSVFFLHLFPFCSYSLCVLLSLHI